MVEDSAAAPAATVGDATAPASRRPVDPMALRRWRDRLLRAPAAPWLHGEVARRMAERLSIIRHQPQVVIDWGARAGASGPLLAAAYPQARRLGVYLDAAPPPWRTDPPGGQPPPMGVPPWWSPRRWRRGAGGTPTSAAANPAAWTSWLAASELPAQEGELLWANMALHTVPDAPAAMREWLRALAVDGFLMFSTLGPGSLQALRALYADAGWPSPHAPFVDMHDLGDMLVEAGFADPVMDQETLRLTWPSAGALLNELRGLGLNADPRRFAGLRGRRWRAALEAKLGARADAEGRIALDLELVYGHAVRPPPRLRMAAESSVAVQDLQAMARMRRPRSG